MVMPRSRSRSFESITRSVISWLARKAPLWRSMASTRVVFPWSTWAMMATLRSDKTPNDTTPAGGLAQTQDSDAALVVLPRVDPGHASLVPRDVHQPVGMVGEHRAGAAGGWSRAQGGPHRAGETARMAAPAAVGRHGDERSPRQRGEDRVGGGGAHERMVDGVQQHRVGAPRFGGFE